MRVGGSERIMGISIVSYGKNTYDQPSRMN
jgi:hypothetical protein